MSLEPILVSACCIGFNCRYNGKNLKIKDPQLNISFKNNIIIPVCPELLGNLPIPRSPANIRGGTGHDVLDNKAKVMNENNCDVTNNFISGANECLKICRRFNIKKAYLAERSPSCGVSKIYTNSGIVEGMGVASALLDLNGIKITGIDH